MSGLQMCPSAAAEAAVFLFLACRQTAEMTLPFGVRVRCWSEERHFEVFAVSPHLQARCAYGAGGFGGGVEGEEGGLEGGGGEFLTVLLMSCDNEQHPLTLSKDRSVDSEQQSVVSHHRAGVKPGWCRSTPLNRVAVPVKHLVRRWLSQSTLLRQRPNFTPQVAKAKWNVYTELSPRHRDIGLIISLWSWISLSP
ncbi:hypothetical protein NQZ68_022569 [Dissostichus eleginoides]|nr:hypothetical protein NQZ68_022569 [Dissostichus eleginoides]